MSPPISASSRPARLSATSEATASTMVGESVTRWPAGSCAFDTVAEFVTLGAAAGPTPTVRLKAIDPPGVMGPGCVATTTPPDSVKVQLTPLAET